MAKTITTNKSPIQGHPEKKRFTIHAYRVERLSTYEYQCYRTTKHEDGTFTEEPFGKPTLVDLIMRKVYDAIKIETNDVFQHNKKFSKK